MHCGALVAVVVVAANLSMVLVTHVMFEATVVHCNIPVLERLIVSSLLSFHLLKHQVHLLN